VVRNIFVLPDICHDGWYLLVPPMMLDLLMVLLHILQWKGS